MPRGLYSHRDPADGTVCGYERFSCAPGPSGWRYTAEVLAADGVTPTGAVDIVVDRDWRLVRLEMRGGGWRLRGGAAGADVVWVRSDPVGSAAVEGSARAISFTGRSPAFAVVTARLLGLTALSDARGACGAGGEANNVTVSDARGAGGEANVAPGGSVRARLVALTEPVLAPRTVDEGWALTDLTPHQTPTVPLPVERYEVADLATGQRQVVHLAGDVVLAGPGVELEELDGPPSLAGSASQPGGANPPSVGGLP